MLLGTNSAIMSSPGGAARALTLVLILGAWTAGSDALEMTIFNGPLEVLLNKDVILECHVTGFIEQVLNLAIVAVEWRLGSHQVYSFNGGDISANRTGAKIISENLKSGDASLHLPKVQISDEGDYTCIVFVTPAKVEKRSSIMVLAKPKVILSPHHIKINNGSEGTLTCDVNEFYPEMPKISWVKVSRGAEMQITTGIVTRDVITNKDSTFSVSSELTIRPTVDDNGNQYKCVVQHRDIVIKEAELTVGVEKPEEPEEHGPGAVIGGVIGVVLIVIVVFVLAALYLWKKQNQAPPKINEISKPTRFIHGQRVDLSWEVTGFKPKEIEIMILLTRKGKQPLELFVWKFTKNKNEPGQVEEGFHLLKTKNGSDGDNLFSADTPQCDQLEKRTFRVKCHIWFCPDVSEDDGAQITMQVHHKALKQPLKKSVTLDVEVPPMMTEINVPSGIVHGVNVPLTWEVNGFKPQAIVIAVLVKRKVDQEAKQLFLWQIPEKGKQPIPHDITPSIDTQVNSFTAKVATIEKTDKGTFSMKCRVAMCADVIRDNDAEFTVEVKHQAVDNPLTKAITLCVAAPPIITEWQTTPDMTHGDTSILSWSVTRFNPHPIVIAVLVKRKGESRSKKLWHWQTEKEQPAGNKPVNIPVRHDTKDDSINPEMAVIVQGKNGTFSVKCCVTMNADVSRDDGTQFTVEVEHDALENPLTESVTLHVKGVPPQIKFPNQKKMKHGENAELQWAVTGFTPGKISIVSSLRRKEEEVGQLFHWEVPNKEAFQKKRIPLKLEDKSERSNNVAFFTAVVPKCEHDTKEGTFRVHCRINMTPDQSTDDGAELIVQVQHEEFPDFVTDRLKINIDGVPPQIIGPILPKKILHAVKDTVTCLVTGFTPGNMSIIFSLKRNGQQQKIQQLFHWEIPNKKIFQESIGGAFPLQHRSDRDNEDASFTALVPKCEPIGDGTFRVNCIIDMIPDIDTDNGAELSVEVHHDILAGSLINNAILLITTASPTITKIEVPPNIKHGATYTLKWSVIGFHPRPIVIGVKLKRGGGTTEKKLFKWQTTEKTPPGVMPVRIPIEPQSKGDLITSEEAKMTQDKTGNFRVNCSVTMVADVSSDDGAEFIVKVKHRNKPLTESVTLHVTGETQ